MSENAEEIEVTVTVPKNDTEPEVENSPVVIINEDDSDDGSEAVEAATINQEGRIVALELGQAAILAALEEIKAAVVLNAEATAAVAEEVEAVEEQVQEVAEEAQEAPESDEEPDREHPFYRNRRFFGRAE